MDALLSYPMQSSNGAHIQIISGTTINDNRNKGLKLGDMYICLYNNPKTDQAVYSVTRADGVQLNQKEMEERAFLTKQDFTTKLESLENAVIVYCDLPDEEHNLIKRSVYEIKNKCFRRVNVDGYRADFPTEDFFEDI